MDPHSLAEAKRHGSPGMTLKLAKKTRIEIVPIGVALLDEANLPGAIPTFYLLFPSDGIMDIGVHLEPHEIMDAISLGEALKQIMLVPIDAFGKVARDARIQCPVTFAGEDVDVV